MENRERKKGVSNKNLFYSMIGVFAFSVLLMIILVFAGPSDKALENAKAGNSGSQNQSGNPGQPSTDPKEDPDNKRKKELEILCSRIRNHITSGELEAAESLLSSTSFAFPDNTVLSALKSDITEEKKNKKSEKTYRIFLDSAERAAFNEQWSLAAANYENALAIKKSADIQKKLESARFNNHLNNTDEYISKGDMSKALSEYKKLLTKAHDPVSKQKADELFRKISASKQIALQIREYESYRSRAEDMLEKEAFRSARSLFAVAINYTTSETQDEYIRSRLLFCDEKIAKKKERATFDSILKKARTAEKNGDAHKALSLYKQAQNMFPGNRKVQDKIRELSLSLLPDVITDKAGITMALIPGGVFTRGSRLSTSDDCKPERSVYISLFYIDISEITNFQYGQFNPFHKPSPQSQGDNMPVTNISWQDAVKYCEWRSKKNNSVYRLPYEAEWEKAARGGEKRTFSWGYTYSKNKTRANLNAEAAVSATSFEPNPYGLYNMSGNVWEWCMDWYSPDYYKQTVSRNPTGPVKGTHRIVRGGSFRFSEKSCRTYERNAEKPDNHVFDIGFRCIRVVIKEEEEEEEEMKDDVPPGVILK